MSQTPEHPDGAPVYQLAHTAPVDDGYSHPITALTEAFPADVYEHPDWYGTPDAETMQQLGAVRNDPGVELTIYRAVPADHQEINRGDWVTLSRQYAETHAMDLGPDGDGVVVSATVPADMIFTDGNDIAEYGYVGERIAFSAGADPSTQPTAGAGYGAALIASKAPETTHIVFIRNTESSQLWRNPADEHRESIEPAGRYMTDSGMDSVEAVRLPDERWEAGQVTFRQPLYLEWGESGSATEPDHWKTRLSNHYGGATGDDLSRRVAADGYDGIITHDRYGHSEIVDLTHLHRQTAAQAGPEVDAAQLKKAFEARDFAQGQQKHPISHAAGGLGKTVNKVNADLPQKSHNTGQERGR